MKDGIGASGFFLGVTRIRVDVCSLIGRRSEISDHESQISGRLPRRPSAISLGVTQLKVSGRTAAESPHNLDKMAAIRMTWSRPTWWTKVINCVTPTAI